MVASQPAQPERERTNDGVRRCRRRHRQGFNKNDTPLNILSVASQIDRRLSKFLRDRNNEFQIFSQHVIFF
jgi:hypothetical protein